MARLSQICLATLALMIAVTSAAPCGHDHGLQEQSEHNVDIDHHTNHPDNDIEIEWEIEEDGDELDGDEWEFEDDCHTDCYVIDDTDYDNDNGNGHHGNGNGNGNGNGDGHHGNGNHGNGNGNGNHGNGNGNGNNGNGDSNGNDGSSDNGNGVGVGGGSDDGSDPLVNVEAGYIGTGDINAQSALTDVVGLDDAHIHDLVQGADVL